LSLFACAALDDFVQLTAIQPDAPTLGTIVDLDALALAHDQIDFAGGAKKPMTFVISCGICDVYHFSLLSFEAKPRPQRAFELSISYL